jgi:hypothetical protein
VDVKSHLITTVLVLTPDYIEKNFGRFGAPTLKHQLIITSKARQKIIGGSTVAFSIEDTLRVQEMSAEGYVKPTRRFNQLPAPKGEVLSSDVVMKMAGLPIVGQKIEGGETKNRGQILERLILSQLGYVVAAGELLEGQYPDIKHQLLEVKIQDSPTIDLGKYTPQESTLIFPDLGITTKDIRYMIVLMNPESSKVEGVVLMPGQNIGEHFSYVDGISGKSQRAIKMSVFDRYAGMCVFNPPPAALPPDIQS